MNAVQALHPVAMLVSAGYWEEEHSYSRRSWESYQRELLQELNCHGQGEEDKDEDDDRFCDSD